MAAVATPAPKMAAAVTPASTMVPAVTPAPKMAVVVTPAPKMAAAVSPASTMAPAVPPAFKMAVVSAAHPGLLPVSLWLRITDVLLKPGEITSEGDGATQGEPSDARPLFSQPHTLPPPVLHPHGLSAAEPCRDI
ncbi:hypothetical protein DPEC_G00139420 [Dallia pectoralis]|uniref:Uncharacterized protein n=1 Tax=Dallia pectoralis TaxID=75939 RepID=A0ACC2GLW4_DALPE|nr:hypothetical protein DPEC_G00139420 [Dallia pectoralis]